MKPGTLIGTEDRILNTWARFAKSYGFLPLIGNGSTKYNPNFKDAFSFCKAEIALFQIKSCFVEKLKRNLVVQFDH